MIYILYSNFLPNILEAIVVNITILMELKGINIAAITGSNCPVTAKYNPMILYKNDNKKLHLIILIADFEAFM